MRFAFLCAGLVVASLTAFGQEQPERTRPSVSGRSGAQAPLTGRGMREGDMLPAVAGKMLTFEVLIADLTEPTDTPTVPNILELEKAGKLNFAARVQLTTLEEQPAFVQFGELLARVSGRAAGLGGFAGRGGAPGVTAIPIYDNVNIGTIAQVTGRVEQDGSILAKLYVERSGLAGGPEQVFDPNDVRPPKSVERLLTETTVRLNPGEPQLIGGKQVAAGKEANKSWVVITGHIGVGMTAKKAEEAK